MPPHLWQTARPSPLPQQLCVLQLPLPLALSLSLSLLVWVARVGGDDGEEIKLKETQRWHARMHIMHGKSVAASSLGVQPRVKALRSSYTRQWWEETDKAAAGQQFSIEEQLLHRNVKRFLAFKAHILLSHSTLGSRVIKKKKQGGGRVCLCVRVRVRMCV